MPTGKPESSIEERFLRKTIETPCKYDGFDPCWIWTGAKSAHKDAIGFPNPYSQLTRQTYKTTMGHQWASHNWNGSPLPVEKGMCVKHLCDTRLCVNPAHLEYGTLQENINEMVERNPTAMGRIVPSEEELILLRQMIVDDVPRREKARRIGHSRHWVDRIIREYFPETN